MSTKTGKKENLKSTIGQTLKNALNLPENFEVKRFEVASCSVFSGLEITMRGYLPDDSEEVVSQEKPAVSRVDKKKNDVKPEKKNTEKKEKAEKYKASELDPDTPAHVSFVRKELKEMDKAKKLNENQSLVLSGLGRGRISRVQAAQLINMYRELLRQR
jgi:hypothetical protein